MQLSTIADAFARYFTFDEDELLGPNGLGCAEAGAVDHRVEHDARRTKRCGVEGGACREQDNLAPAQGLARDVGRVRKSMRGFRPEQTAHSEVHLGARRQSTPTDARRLLLFFGFLPISSV